MKHLRSGCWLALSFLVSGVVAQDADGRRARPNVVFIMADDLGYGELGCYGQQHIKTPNLDRMAGQGLRMLQHYSGAPVCAPARCVLMTGRHSGHATVRDNQEHQPEGQLPIGDAELTVAELMRQNGYATGCFGKWGLGYPGGEGDPLNQGFDRFFGYNCQRHAHNFYPRYLWDDDRKLTLEGNDRGVSGAQYSHDVISEQMLEFVRAHKDEPFFLYVPSTLPHLALQVPDETLALYRGKFEETPYSGRSYQPHPTPRAAYAAMITHLDRAVGSLLDLLEELDLADDTLVIFTSDNGPTHLKAQADVDFFASAGGLRGLKGSVYEGGIRVPMIARWPGRIAPGTTSSHVSCFQDLMATMADLCSVDKPASCDGISYLPTLLGHPVDQQQHENLVWDFAGYGGQHAVRQGRWKLVRTGQRRKNPSAWELYDLEVDSAEANDVASEHPEVVRRLEAVFHAQRTKPEWPKFQFGDYRG
jgi:arylsulfatase A